MFVPTLVTFLWVTTFGNSALQIEMFGAGGIAKAVQENIPVSLFVLLENFPLDLVTSLLAVVVVVTFFVTSSDSGSLVIDIITAGGNTDPPVVQRVFWAVMEGLVAAALLLGGAIILLGMCLELHKGLSDYKSGQSFELQIEDYQGPEFRTGYTRKMPTFGRRKFWLKTAERAATRPQPRV